MRCPNPKCKSIDSRVLESNRGDTDNSVIRRRRECLKCQLRFTSYEVLEESLVDPIVFDSLNENQDHIFKNLLK